MRRVKKSIKRRTRFTRRRNTGAKRQEYQWYDYDVWGNAKDGYDVNNVFRTPAFVTLAENATDAQIVASLRKAGILKARTQTKRVQIDGETGYTLYFMDRKDGMPLGELRAV